MPSALPATSAVTFPARFGGVFGSGGGTGDEMEPRFKALEDKFGRIEPRLDAIISDLAIIKATVATKDDMSKISERVGKLETAVSMLPGTITLILFVLAVLGIAGIAKYLAP
jgi:hypothetical protein